ncbi:TPM domain-containing protein [Clostridium sp. CF011]|uniref:TPM domain-containing protein n=1 Tax=Clostridium sp. CF011 TaxID=2843318 RepID=UPI001C0D882B|nr:TPM domain-containing protein [Clostridium sp. CF011]MBU3091316.1 TPM domain-containing protein [Clostridium sp. CF011]WAG68624.1 TPM domain-containing protein [Clostridium sp. CF011]
MKNYLMKLIRKIYDIPWRILNKEKIKMRIIFVGMISIFLLSQITAMKLVNAETEYPKATELKYVNDYGKVIDSKSAEYILSIGKELEAKTGAQATVVVIDSLQGETIESYATGIFRSFGIGQKYKNNGLLILLSMEEKKWRVEVGTGLEGAVTDIYSSSVMNDFAVPKFKENQYGEGLRAAYSALADNIAKEYNVKLDKDVNVPQYVGDSNVFEDSNVLESSDLVERGKKSLVIGFFALWLFQFVRNIGNGDGFGGGSSSDGGSFGDFGGSGDDSGGFGGGSSSGGGSSGGW